MKHLYGDHVHILDEPILSGLLAELCSPETYQPKVNQLVHLLYQNLVYHVIQREFPTIEFSEPTRMTALHPHARAQGKKISPNQKAISVNLARAGTYPSHTCYEYLHWFLPAQNIRQDHIFASRISDEAHHVKGTALGSSKIGGGVKDSIVIIPDPMAATGSTMVATLDYYKKNIEGPAKKWIAIHLIVTPEYLKNLRSHHPDLIIYAIRLDRGLSSTEVLKLTPGEKWDQEKGLNDHQYIVPGGGGFGEIMNNSFV